jgi:hypothetical protein
MELELKKYRIYAKNATTSSMTEGGAKLKNAKID